MMMRSPTCYATARTSPCAAFFEFTTFAILEMRFLLSVWRARRPGGSMDPWTAQRELSILYGRFYGALLGGILLSYYLQRCARYAAGQVGWRWQQCNPWGGGRWGVK